MKLLTSLSAIALIGAASLALAGCSAPSTDGSDTDGQLRVVATTTQLADFAAQIGGEDIELTGLLPSGGSAHHFDPTAADLLALGQADVLIVNGAGLETFIDSAVEASGFAGTIIDASTGIDLDLAREITAEAETGEGHDHDHDHAEDAADHDHDHDHADAAEEHTEDEGHGHAEDGEEHDHDHGDLNPHLWTSPRFAEGMVAMIAGDLARIDPAHADDYLERSDAYIAKLAALDEWIAAQFERVPAAERVLVSGHDSLRYYLHDYGIAFAGSILPSFEDNAEPSAAEIEALVDTIRERGVKAIFVESSMSPKLAQTIAAEAGIAVVDAEALYADSLGPAGSGADSYLGATIRNTTTILEAWGVTLDPLPEALR
ncbi:MAG: metal ABC transporter substrate-binding protein [Leucobacter sp.]